MITTAVLADAPGFPGKLRADKLSGLHCGPAPGLLTEASNRIAKTHIIKEKTVRERTMNSGATLFVGNSSEEDIVLQERVCFAPKFSSS